MANDMKLLTVAQTAKMLGCSAPTVRKLIETGSLQAIKTNKGEARTHWGILEPSAHDWKARSSRRKALRDAAYSAASSSTPHQSSFFPDTGVAKALEKLLVEAKKQTKLLDDIQQRVSIIEGRMEPQS